MGCTQDSHVQWIGNWDDGSCDIEVTSLREGDHEGEWSCVFQAAPNPYVDTIDVKLKGIQECSRPMNPVALCFHSPESLVSPKNKMDATTHTHTENSDKTNDPDLCKHNSHWVQFYVLLFLSKMSILNSIHDSD